MLYLKRKIDFFLSAWKSNPDRKPLIVKGPRQVGKTESIRRFGEQNYKSVISINFVEEPKYKMITTDGYKAEDIIKNISRIDPSKRFIEGETLFFFDELQEFPEIATALKFFKIDGRFDVICSGSMLGINYRKIESNSVGYKSDYEMFSLDFEEFLWAKGYDDSTVEDMLEHMRTLKPFNEVEMSVYSELFLDYCILGGMPAVVREFVEKGTFEGSLEVQRQLIVCYCMNFPELPLQGNYDETKYKLYFADSGLLVAMLDEEAQVDLRSNKNLGVYKGALYENVVGEALVKSGYRLYYYKRDDSSLEQDFFVRTANALIPVEVKAQNGMAKSIRTLISGKKYADIHCGIKFTGSNMGYGEQIYTFPYFCAFLLKRYLAGVDEKAFLEGAYSKDSHISAGDEMN